MCFKPKNERSRWLAAEGLHSCASRKLTQHGEIRSDKNTKSQSEEKRLPARKIPENNFDGVRFALRDPTNS